MKSPTRILLASLMALGATSASALNLPSGPCDGLTNCIQYTDFQVYSLPLLNAYYQTNAFDVNSTYGQNQSNIIVGINNGQSNNGSLIDPAFNTPSANNISTFTNMTTDVGTGNGQNQVMSFGTGDGLGWDASVSALKTNLGTSNLVGFFAFNETGQNDLNGSDLLIWVHVQLRDLDANGNVIGFKDYYLQPTGSTKTYDPNFVSNGGATAPWTYVHAGLCLKNDGSLGGFPDVNGVCPAGSKYADQSNLGQNNAAFAVYSQDLDWQVKNGAWDILHIDWKMDYLNGGGETAWLMPFGVDNNVPEPSTLLLLGAALIGLGATKRVRKT
jgi:hypothetical protein